MRIGEQALARLLRALVLSGLGWWAAAGAAGAAPPEDDPGGLEPLGIERVPVQGLQRTVRFYRPARLAEPPALVLALHGAGGDGERFRRLTGGAFERLADRVGFVLAYPDALGGRWRDCRTDSPYQAALAGIDEVAFLRAVGERARGLAGDHLAGIYGVGYSNGGHLLFRIAFEAPDALDALAVIGAALPVPGEDGCTPGGQPPPVFLVSGTHDPISPWAGGRVQTPLGDSPGRVISVEATAVRFAELAGAGTEPAVVPHPDTRPEDGTRVETRHWHGSDGAEVVLMAVFGGGHSLPHPSAPFPAKIVGPTSRDLDASEAIWRFFARHGAGAGEP